MTARIITGDARTALADIPDGSIQCTVTSPPYFGLRDYGNAGQIGLEPTLAAYVANLVAVFREVRRCLRDDGTLWLNLGDSYAGSWGNQGRKETRGTQRPINGEMLTPVHDGRYPSNGSNTGVIRDVGLKPKDLMMVPARVALALQDDGWYLRSDIIWHKTAPMPESVTDRPTSAHEHIFLLTKRKTYYYDADAIAEPTLQPLGKPTLTAQHKADAGGFTTNGHGASSLGTNQGAATRNARNVWTLGPAKYAAAHFATFPPELPRRCILAGSRVGDTVLDPFAGAGTTLLVADRLGRHGVGVELNPEYVALAEARIRNDAPMFAEVAS